MIVIVHISIGSGTFHNFNS